MKNRYLLSALALGLGLTAVLMLPLARPIPVACADPAVYYVRAGGTGTTCTLTDPCGSAQQAINLAGDGDEVWVATGTYVENLVITRGLSLRGGWDASFAVQAPATYPTTIDGSGDHVISATVETGSALIECFTIRNGRDGIHLYAGTITVARNTVRDASRQGIEIEDGHILLENNLFTDIEREGIEIDGGTVTVLSNTVDGVGCHGILVEGGDVTIEGNLIRDVQGEDYHGIRIEVSGVVTGNEIFNIGDRGIEARGGAVVIVNNTVRDTGGDGIRTSAASTNVEIRGNTISNIGNDGIDARGVTVTVASNTVSACADNGIKSEGASHTFINANQVYGDGDAGIDLDNAGTFTVTNNIVADSSVASILIQNSAGPHNFLYHNTLVGSATGQQGVGISVTVPGITITLVNNIVVSHSVSITATPGTTLIVSSTLLWGNGEDPTGGTLLLPPLFVAPAQQNYHLRPDSPAIDVGIDVGVTSDVDGDSRPIGDLPDIGADEVRLRNFLPLVLRDY